MLNRVTTVVVGAGASKCFNFPLGAELKSGLSRSLDIYFDDFGRHLERGSDLIVGSFRELSADNNRRDINPLIMASRDIALAMPSCGSIDDYIERHAGDSMHELCAKLAIAENILLAERESPLFVKNHTMDTFSMADLGSCWISRLLQITTRGQRVEKLPAAFSKLKVINFNYDRCFEHFTLHWLMQVYRMPRGEALKIVSEIEIVHPYGTLGNLFSGIYNGQVPFGSSPSSKSLLHIAKGIKTYSESVDEDEQTNYISNIVNNSNNFIFLGFAFHVPNMNLIRRTPHSSQQSMRVFASSVGLSPAKIDVVRSRLSDAMDIGSDRLFTSFNDKSCEELFNEYEDSMMA